MTNRDFEKLYSKVSDAVLTMEQLTQLSDLLNRKTVYVMNNSVQGQHLSNSQIGLLEQCIKEGRSMSETCKVCSVSTTTYYRHKRKYDKHQTLIQEERERVHKQLGLDKIFEDLE